VVLFGNIKKTIKTNKLRLGFPSLFLYIHGMKDFINTLLIGILSGFTLGLTKIIVNTRIFEFGFLYVPLFALMIMLGVKLYDDYTR
jgi:hypothetical protein